MKLYVWEGVLADWSDGIAFAYARDAEHARRLVLRKVSSGPARERLKAELAAKPKVFGRAVGYAQHGGS